MIGISGVVFELFKAIQIRPASTVGSKMELNIQMRLKLCFGKLRTYSSNRINH